MSSSQAARRARAAPSKVASVRRKDDARTGFNAETFLATAGVGRTLLNLKKDETLFTQADPADTIFYIQSGQVKLTVVAASGKEATLALLGAGDFAGEQCVTGGHPIRLTTARAMSDCVLLRISRAEMVRVLHQQHAMSDVFVGFLLTRNARIQEDLVDQLFNSSEKRLARVLLLLAHFGKDGKTEEVIPKISQEMLAEMVGTTRSRISFFMNRFRKLGFIQYDSAGTEIHSSLLNVILHD
jgi:CRP/FNR family transcriptional regulator, cyclic AMP receptor protein